MLFNSIDFAIFLPIVFILYWFVTNRNLKLQNLLIVIASYVFYGWWDYRFLTLIIFSTIVDYSIGVALSGQENKFKRKVLLWTSIVINLGFLGFFKYYNFFVDNFVTAFTFFGSEIKPNTLNIILPVGISFYTFQTLSYTIDVYRQKLEPTKDFIAFSAFVSFFPQLVAGPIERATNLLPQFYRPKNFKFINMQYGFIRILWGLFKKVVIADQLASMVNIVYNSPDQYGGLHFIIATLFFAFQIYCDFSGYSDIAIGLARLLDIKLMNNFNNPYLSKSLSEFWSRWHISLSTWFRDYLYIPLGGNRVSKMRWLTNLLIVFIISGFWHGAQWTFILWGACHGIILIVENFKLRIKYEQKRALLVFKTVLTFSIVCFSWIFFRANSTNDLILILSQLFDFSSSLGLNLRGQLLYLGNPLWKFTACFILIFALMLVEYFIDRKKISEIKIINLPTLKRWSLYTILILMILIFGNFELREFIYFQF